MSVDSPQQVSVSSEDVALGIPPPENKVFYPALDGVRAFAILLVFLQHYILSRLPAWTRWGWAGVDIFFVLSGFLITGILFDTRDTEHRFRNFYVRRTLRIFPLYYGVFLLAVLLTPILHFAWTRIWLLWPMYLGNYARFVDIRDFALPHDPMEALSSYTSRHVLYFGHFWSLCVEEQFYLVWPLVVFAIRDRVRLRNFCIAAVILEPFVRWAVRDLAPQRLIYAELLYRATPLRADALLLGGALALMLRGKEAGTLRRLAPHMFYFFTSCLLAFAIFNIHLSSSPQRSAKWIETFGYTILDLAAAGMLLVTIQPGSYLYRVFSLRPLRRLGQVSYGFYVFHDIPHNYYDLVSHKLFGHFVRRIELVTPLVAFAFTLILSFLSFRYFEAPFLRLKDRFTV